jgi:hypothetical protein
VEHPVHPGRPQQRHHVPFPVRYLEVQGASGAQVLTGDAGAYDELFVSAAKQLEGASSP